MTLETPAENGEVICRKEKLEDFYEIKEELGRGQFAVVKRCLSKSDQVEVAAKYIKLKRTRTSKNGLSREAIKREAAILKSLNHERVIKFHDLFDLEKEMVLVLELLSGGELFDKICELEYLTEVDACIYMKQVLEAIDHLHDNNIVHLDIKPENIVLKSKETLDIKLVDFGLAQRLYPGHDLKEMMGTPEFVAPEVINYETIGLYTDMWAIGVLAYILLSGCSPFLGDNNQETYENIVKVDYHFDEEYFDSISDHAKNFVKDLLIKNPSKRNTVKGCLDHPWIYTMSTSRSRHDSTVIATGRFKAFVARRRWQQSFQKLNAITRFSKFLKKGGNLSTFDEEGYESTSPSPSPNPSPKLERAIKNLETTKEEEPSLDLLNTTEVKSNLSETDPEDEVNSETIQSFNNDQQAADISKEKINDSHQKKVNIQISINEISSQVSKSGEKKDIITQSLDSRFTDTRKISLSAKTNSPPQRKYSREDPVRYTEILRENSTEETIGNSLVKSNNEDILNFLSSKNLEIPSKKMGSIKEEADTMSEKHDEINATTLECDESSETSLDKNLDKRTRTSSRKKAVLFDHKDFLDNENSHVTHKTRSVSLNEQRKAFILGRRSNTSAGVISLKERIQIALNESQEDTEIKKEEIGIKKEDIEIKREDIEIKKEDIEIKREDNEIKKEQTYKNDNDGELSEAEDPSIIVDDETSRGENNDKTEREELIEPDIKENHVEENHKTSEKNEKNLISSRENIENVENIVVDLNANGNSKEQLDETKTAIVEPPKKKKKKGKKKGDESSCRCNIM